MKMHNPGFLSRAAFGLGIVLAIPSAALAQGDQSEQCEVEFSSGVNVAGQDQISTCLQTFRDLQVTRFELVGYATPEGPTAANQRLSERRADMVMARLKEEFPNVTIDSRGGGEDAAQGRKVIVTAFVSGSPAVGAVGTGATGTGATGTNAGTGDVNELGATTPNDTRMATDPVTGGTMVDESSRSTAGVDSETPSGAITTIPQGGSAGGVAANDTGVTSGATTDTGVTSGAATDTGTPLQRENIPEGWNDVRVAARVGYDNVWDRDEYMNALGVDVGYVRRNLGTRLARLEVGGTASFLGEPAEDLKHFNFHGTVFPALEVGPLVFGPRGMLGGSWDDRRKNTVLDAGGEGRLGLEAANYSVFVGAGRTMEYTRIGLDVGATF